MENHTRKVEATFPGVRKFLLVIVGWLPRRWYLSLDRLGKTTGGVACRSKGSS